MLTNPVLSLGNKIQKVIRIADQLALSLRENVELIDFEGANATFVTESGYILEGTVDFKNQVFEDITVATGDIFEDKKKFDSLVTKRIHSILGSLLQDDRYAASNKYDSILHLWEARSKYDRVMERLQERKAAYALYTRVLESEQFASLEELRPQLVKFLSENKDELLKIRQIINSLNLSNTISEAFDLPRIEDCALLEGAKFSVADSKFNSIYDIVCQQELIKKDLLENKKAFSNLWLNSEEINELIACIGDKTDDDLVEVLSRLISENLYFALATKKQLSEVIQNSLAFNDIDSFTQRDVKKFVAKIYEIKRHVKKHILEGLSDKFGIDVQSLKATPSFQELGKTQKVIFETLGKVAPRGSILKITLNEMAKIIGAHSGVDVIDINDWLVDVFLDAGFEDHINETSLMSYMNFEKVAQDLAKIGDVLKMLQVGMGDMAGGGNPMAKPEMGAGGMGDQMGGMGGEEMPEEGQYDPDGMGEMEMEDEEGGLEEEPEDGEDISPEEAAMGAQEDMAGEMSDDLADESEEEGPEQIPEEEFMGYLDELEELISSLKGEMGFSDFDGDEEGEEESEFGDEEEEGNGEEGEMDLDTGEGDDSVHVDINSHDNEDEEEVEGSDGEDSDDDGDIEEPKPKKKPFPPKK